MGCNSSTASGAGVSSRSAAESAHIHTLLSSSPFFLVLSPAELLRFSEQFTSRKVKPGEKVFAQGEEGEELFVVGEGECDITCVGAPVQLADGTSPHTIPSPQKRNKAAQMLSGSGVVGGANFLCSKKKGDFFGERAVLSTPTAATAGTGTEKSKQNLRSATVTATTPTELLVLTRANFQSFMQSLDPDSQARLSTVLGTRMIDSLRQIDFLHSLDDMRLGLLANVFRYVTLQAGETVFEEGDLGRDLYIISDGTVSVSARSGGTATKAAASNPSGAGSGEATSPASRGAAVTTGQLDSPGVVDVKIHSDSSPSEMEFATLNPGQYFGEVALMIDMPRTATVRATSRCLLLVISRVDFGNFVAITPGLREKFTALASSRIAQQFRKWNVPFFQSIPEHRFQALSDLCRMEAFDAGTVIFREGDETAEDQPAFYLAVAGTLTATKEGVGVVATLTPPQYFGEVALVTDSPRTATITCSTRCVLLSLTRGAFETFFLSGEEDQTSDSGAGGEQYAEFSIKLSQRQVPLKPVLQHTLGSKLFRVHLGSEYSTENLDFFQKSLLYEMIDERINLEEQTTLAGELISHYIRADAETQINIPAAVRESCLAEYREGRITRGMFAPARAEIFKLMAADSFKRFKQSPLFQQLLDAVGTYGHASATPSFHRHITVPTPHTSNVTSSRTPSPRPQAGSLAVSSAPSPTSSGSHPTAFAAGAVGRQPAATPSEITIKTEEGDQAAAAPPSPLTPLQPQLPLSPDSKPVQLLKARHSVKIHSPSSRNAAVSIHQAPSDAANA